MIEVRKVESKNQLKGFIDFPHELYRGDANYVPGLFTSQKDLLSKKHPFFRHSTADFFLAYRGRDLVGRVAAIRNNNYISYTGKEVGFFGFIEFIDDRSVSEALLMTVKEWIKKEGLTGMMGPGNYSTNESCGTLIEGFDSPPTVMMTFNKRYYPEHFEHFGLGKAMDLLAYEFIQSSYTERLQRVGKLLEERLTSKGITIRKFDLSKFSEEIEKIKKIYNLAWEKNWGFVPMTDEEFTHAAKGLKQIVDPDFLLIAEHEGEPIGYSLALPDFNEVLKKVKRGRLFPTGLIKILLNRSKIKGVRIITLGIVEEYRKMGIDAFFYFKVFDDGIKKGFTVGEASWILENNEMMNRAIIKIGGELSKKYRLYSMNF